MKKVNSSVQQPEKLMHSYNLGYKNLKCFYWEHDIWLRAFELSKFLEAELKKITEITEKLKEKTIETIFNVHYNVAKALCSEHLNENIAICTLAKEALEKNHKQIVTLLNYNKIDRTFLRKYEVLQGRLENKLVNLSLKFSMEKEMELKT